MSSMSFALTHFISSHAEKLSDEMLSDVLLAATPEDLPALFAEHEIVAWAPFEHYADEDLMSEIVALACNLDVHIGNMVDYTVVSDLERIYVQLRLGRPAADAADRLLNIARQIREALNIP